MCSVEEHERERLHAQVEHYAELTSTDAEIVREATCDYVGVLGAVQHLTKLDILEPGGGDRTPVAARLVADAFIVGLRTLRLLLDLAAIQQTTQLIAAEATLTAINQRLAEATARANAVLMLLYDEFAALEKAGRLIPDPLRKTENPDRTDADLFLHSATRLVARSHEIMDAPLETLGTFFIDAEAYESARDEVFASLGIEANVSTVELIGIADRLRLRLPF